ncbi:MAG: hypothetical protein JSW58_10495 [Candidatus Latescibacterota bacterium]|nr:MAG: hypothetical protein JSW58_10495 [Candidatus Latescibacterota bacterium]
MRLKPSNRLVYVVAMVSIPVFVGSVAVSSGGDPSAHPPRMWPLDIPIELSSSFGEFRRGHLHAGLDIRTFGKEGVPCRAVGDGCVSRLRSSPYGYGKTVYLTLHTGEIVVYAHLSERSAVLDSVVYDAQVAAGRYRVDLYLEPEALPVRRGEIIGFTGRTGTSAPHLHFEVRDPDQNPLNPLTIGWRLEDAVPPCISEVGWFPLTPSSTVEGACFPVVQGLRRDDSTTFAATDTVRVSGRVGLSARVIDRLTSSSGRLAPYRLELLVDERLLSVIELNRFTYEHTGEVEIAYDMERARTDSGHFLFLFQREGETLWDRYFEGGGVIDTDSLPPPDREEGGRVYTAKVRAIDRGGNVTVATLPFSVPVADLATPSGKRGITRPPAFRMAEGALPGCYFFKDLLNIQRSVIAWGPVPCGPVASTGVAEGSDGRETDWTSSVGQTGQPLSFGIKHAGLVRHVNVLPVPHTQAVKGAFPDLAGGKGNLKTREGSLYSDAFLYLMTWEGDISRTRYPTDELCPVTDAVRVGPLSLAFKSSVEVTFRLDRASDGREAFYRLTSGKDEWAFVSSFVRGDTVSAYVDAPGVYSVFLDTLGPRIGTPRVNFRKSHATGKKSPELVIPILDKGSGVDYERTEVYVDGNKQIARWDGISEKMFVLFRNQNIIGVHDVSVVAVDRMGNASKRDTEFHIPTPKTGDSGRETKHNAP